MATPLQWYAVRCCCDGKRIMGFIELPEDVGPRAVVFEAIGGVHRGGEAVTVWDMAPEARRDLAIASHVIEVRRFGQGARNERAVYSDDRPIEFWRKISGFREVVDDAH